MNADRGTRLGTWRQRGSSRGPGSSRGAGVPAILIAVAIAMILVAIVLLVSGGSGGGSGELAERGIAAEDVPSLLQPVGPVDDLRDGETLGSSTNLRLTLKDRDDPARIAWEVESASSDPVPGTDAYELAEPRARYFVGDGTVIEISSDRASFVMPTVGGEPEAGRFEGDVVVEQIASDGAASEPSAAGFRLTTAWLEFDSLAGEIFTTEPVRIEGDRVVADCVGFSAVLNEVDERLEYFEVRGGLVATIQTAGSFADDRSRDASSNDATETGSATASDDHRADTGGTRAPAGARQPADPPPSPVEQYYAATFNGDVVISQPSRRIRSDRARAWVRLEDNSIVGTGFAGAPTSPTFPIEAALISMTIAGQPETSDRDTDNAGFEAPVTFRCSGPATVIPMSERPAPLGAGDEVALRFEVDEGNRVEFEDDEINARGDADEIAYGMTTKLLSLTGSAEQPARATVAGSGDLVSERLTLGLGTGIGQAEGPGRLTTDAERSVSWTEQADVVFRVAGDWMTGSLEQAIASGGVELIDGGSRVTADDLNARFAEADDTSPIERVVLAGNVDASTERGALTADRVVVSFDVAGGESVPRLAAARGSVRGEQGDQRLWADELDADLFQTDQGETELASAIARTDVRYERGDDTYAIGDYASITVDTREATIEGFPGVVATGTATIESERIELNDAEASIATPTPGRLTITDDSGAPTRLTATWAGSMRYADRTGLLETSGDVEIVSTPTLLTRDTFRGDRLTAIVEPLPEGEGQNAESGVLGNERRLVSAIATGTPERRASAELVRFGGRGAAEPERVTAIVGERIEADNAAGVLRVPAAGRLVLSDTRGTAEAGDAASSAGRGSALFDWDGSMVLDRPAGVASMQRRVRMVHRPGGGSRGVIELECQRLDAAFDAEGGTRLTDPTDGSDLLGVDAAGAVWARSGAQQMLCDTLEYEPVTGVATASAAGSGWVTLFGENRASPITAAELTWAIESGRIEVIRPSPVAVPR
ncbi:MAG: hypothetical protein AAFR96_07745 [Planctomycetota bacterium]